MKALIKKIFFPSGQMIEAEVLHTWTVSWDSCGSHSIYPRRRFQVFIDKDKAQDFSDTLYRAYGLLQNTNGLNVKIESNQ
jgi:hypothetical protein